MHRPIRAVVFVMLAGLLATACGARLDPATRQAAANSQLSIGGGGTGGASSLGGGSATGGGTTGGGGSATGKGSTSSGGSGGGAAGSGGSSNGGTAAGNGGSRSGGGAAAASCPSSGSDVGLTSTALHLGAIEDRSGPVPGLFVGVEQGLHAYQNFINSSGGLCGHAVSFDIADGQTNCSANQGDVDQLVKKDFALVGTFSLYDGCGASELKKFPSVPDVHVALDPSAEGLSNHFDLEPGQLGYATGMWKYYAQKLGSGVQHVGTIAENIPSALAKQHAEVKAAESQGWKFVYTDNASPTTGDFQNDFNKMCGQAHVKVFFTVTENAQNAATMISDENKVAACKGLVNIIPIAYDQAFLTFCKQLGCGSNMNTVQGWNEYSLFFNANEAANIPEVKLFQSWFTRSNPGKPFNLYALFAWADARLFQQAFEHAGKTASRGSVTASLRKIRSFNDGGMIAPANPGSKTTGNTCYVTWHLSNGAFARSDPASGYRCDGTYLKY